LELQEVIAKRKKINPLEFFNHLPLQKLFHNAAGTVKGIFGGNRSGKTEEGAEYVLDKGLKKKLRIWCVAETFADSVSIQQRKVWELVPKDQIKYGYYDEINGFRNRKLVLKNGTLYIFKSYDQGREAFQGDDIDIIWNDEEPPYDIYREQRMRLIDRNGEMIITMTSINGVTDLVHEIFENHTVIKSEYAPLADKELPRIVEKNGMQFFLFWTTENPYIDQSRTQKEASLMTSQEIMSRIYGVPINLAGKIYMKFSTNVHVIPFEHVPLSECCIYFILDPHDRKPWAMCWMAIHKTGTCYIFDEYPNQNFNEMLFDDKTYDEYVGIINEKEANLAEIGARNTYRRIIDPNYGNKTERLAERQGGQSKTTPKNELKKRGLKFVDGIDTIEAGHLKVREYIHYEIKDDEIVVQPNLFITENCENTIRHMSRYSRKDILATDGDVKDNVKPMDKYKDFCDLVRYGLMSNPKYAEGGKVFTPQPRKVY